MKQCNVCLETKDLSEFTAVRPKKSGGFTYAARCKKCAARLALEAVKTRPEVYKERLRYQSERQKRIKEAKYKTMNCPVCETEFTQTEGKQKYCTQACSLAYGQRKYRERVAAGSTDKSKTCKVCEKTKLLSEFTKKAGKICNDCVPAYYAENYKRHKENHSRLRREYKDKNREKFKEYGRAHDLRKRNVEGSHTNKQWNELKAQQDYKCLCCGKREPDIALTRDHILPLIKGGSDDIANIQGLCRNCNSKKATSEIDFRAVS